MSCQNTQTVCHNANDFFIVNYRAFNFGEFVNGKAQQPLPPTIVANESQISDFADSCRNLCRKLLHLLGIGLGVSCSLFTFYSSLFKPESWPLIINSFQVDDFFSSAHDTIRGKSGTILRLLRYPPVDPTARSADDIRAGAHSDYGSITLLFRLKGQAGLELEKKDGSWAPVPVCPPGSESDPSPPILINIGDLLSYWTNGLFRSTVHRVVFPAAGAGQNMDGETNTGPRYSIAFFCHPVGDVRLESVPSDRVKSFVPKDTPNANPYAERKVMTAEEHLFMRLKASYGDLYNKDP